MSQADPRADAESELPLGAVEVPHSVVVPQVDVHLVGYGNRLPNDFTLELLAVLQGCKRVFGAPPIHAPQFGIAPMQDLFDLQDRDLPEQQIDELIAERVLAAAAGDPPVAFATLGSPMVSSSVAHRILTLAAQRDLTVHVTNAVPSFDAIWADFNIEPFYGFEIWDAATFIRCEIQPSTRAHLLLSGAPADHASATILREKLLHSYRPEQEVHVVASPAGTGPHMLAQDIQTLALRDLGAQPADRSLLLARAERASFDFERSVPASAVGGD